MKEKELLFTIKKKDFKIDFFSGKGAGGQHRNKHRNCVRMLHIESGVHSTGQTSKERKTNIQNAFKKIVSDNFFKIWLNRKVHDLSVGESIENTVDRQMDDKNIKTEIKQDGVWVEE